MKKIKRFIVTYENINTKENIKYIIEAYSKKSALELSKYDIKEDLKIKNIKEIF